MLNLPFLAQPLDITIFFKIPLLILIGLYGIVVFMLIVRLNSLNKIVFFPNRLWSLLIQGFTILYFLAILSLFFATLILV
jgi:hypothetical protein